VWQGLREEYRALQKSGHMERERECIHDATAGDAASWRRCDPTEPHGVGRRAAPQRSIHTQQQPRTAQLPHPTPFLPHPTPCLIWAMGYSQPQRLSTIEGRAAVAGSWSAALQS
jgi:hypothetical protein